MSKHRVEFDTGDYRRSHGSEPRGRGSWAFFAKPSCNINEETPFWYAGTYTEARTQAREHARLLKLSTLYVGA